MPNPTRDDIKQAAEHCIARGLCGGCPIWDTHGLRSFHECAAYAFRALLSAYEREEKILEAVKVGREAMRERRLYGDAWERKYGDKWDDEDAQVDSAIKAAEEGR